jgi:hypothetical protein
MEESLTMKSNRTILTALTALLVSHIAAQPGQAQSQGANALQGAWSIEVKFQNAPPGVADFKSLVTFSAGGTTVEDNGGPGLGPATGAWEFQRAGEFGATWFKPVYDFQTGAFQGTVKIRGRIQMKSVDEYESRDKIDFYLPDGTLAGSWTAVQTGKRIKVEPVD